MMIKRKIALLAVVSLIAMIAMSTLASAAATNKVRVFTDKKVYNDDPYIFDGGGIWGDNFVDLQVTIYAIALNTSGHMIKSGVSFTGNLKDVRHQNHSSSAATHHTVDEATNGAYYNVNIPAASFTDADSDGVYEAVIDLAELPSSIEDDHLVINITVTESGVTGSHEILLSRFGCGHGGKRIRDWDASIMTVNGAMEETPCVACHWGQEHYRGGMNEDTLGADPNLWVGDWTSGNSNYDYMTGHVEGSAAPSSNFSYIGRSDICTACHGAWSTSNGGQGEGTLDMFAGTTPTNSDQNNDGIADDDRPSCSQARGPDIDGDSNYPACHASTNIEGAPKPADDDYFWKSNGAGHSYSHTQAPYDPVPCETCHGNHPGFDLPVPNQGTAGYSDIENQCRDVCHTTQDTAPYRGPNCKGCHYNDSNNNGYRDPTEYLNVHHKSFNPIYTWDSADSTPEDGFDDPTDASYASSPITSDASGFQAGQSVKVKLLDSDDTLASPRALWSVNTNGTGGWSGQTPYTAQGGDASGVWSYYVSTDGGTIYNLYDRFTFDTAAPEFPMGAGISLGSGLLIYLWRRRRL